MRSPNPNSTHAKAGLLALAALALAAVPLAAPGTAFVPGAADDGPGWLLGPYGDGLGVSGDLYLAALYVALVASAVVAACAAGLGRRAIWVAIAVGVAAFALAPPLLSLDLFSYVSYGRLGIEGLNPYEHAPADLPADEAAIRVEDYRHATSVYGPLFTLLTYPLAALGVPAAVWTLKALAALSVLALAWLVARLAVLRGVEPAGAAALVALNPITLVHVAGGAHNDGLMMVGVLGAALLVSSGREGLGAVSLAGGFAVKAAGALTAPFALLGARRRARFALAGLGSLAVLGAVATLAFGGSAIDAVAAAGENQGRVSYHSLPALAERATGLGIDTARALLGAGYVALVAWLLLWTARGGDWVRAAGWASLGLLLASAYVTPWYVIWALPLAAVSRDRLLIAATLAFSAYQLPVAIPA